MRLCPNINDSPDTIEAFFDVEGRRVIPNIVFANGLCIDHKGYITRLLVPGMVEVCLVNENIICRVVRNIEDINRIEWPLPESVVEEALRLLRI